ncbi:MAG: hypothetical protein LBS20_06105 [Prevotella sp.]|jgi:hypothetical protein|nr:hypothetical protein [Prevotella sp.]
MNEGSDQSGRRIAEIKNLREFLTKASVTKWMMRSFENSLNPDTAGAIGKCIDALFSTIDSGILDFEGMYRIFGEQGRFMSGSEYLTFIHSSEEIIRDFLKIEELESKERYYKLEMEFIREQGYALNERYIISFPENPGRPDEEWVVSEFRTGRNNRIRPVHGFKIKKNGEPYARAQYIYLGSDDNCTLTKREQ